MEKKMTSTVIYEGELRTVAQHTASGTRIETDAPVDNHGKGEKFSPSDLVATALGSCMLTIMGMKARDLEIDLKGTRIEIQKFMKADPRRISGISLTFHLPNNLHLSEKNKTILQRAADTCPVFYSIHPDIDVQVNYNWQNVIENAL
ncbi:MAG TPA: OsmC family protein [Puia sp.]|nr:OsmC family protein [Puia sp.]